MKRLKKEALEKLTSFQMNEFWQTGKSITGDLDAFHPAPGAHEKEEAIEQLVLNSMLNPRNHEEGGEIEGMARKLISYLEFHNYSYGISLLPVTYIFYENENGFLATETIKANEYKWEEYKAELQKELPESVIIYVIDKDLIRMTFTDVTLIYDNEEYVEYYKPEKT
jgi:hypothetical protein